MSGTGEALFQRLVGPAFASLPAALRGVHCGAPRRDYAGRCSIRRGSSFGSRVLGVLAGLPPARDDVELAVSIAVSGDAEVWVRDFGGHGLRSTLRAAGGLLEERMGLAAFRFTLAAEPEAIRWDFAAARWAGVALPRRWIDIRARESVVDGRYQFDVAVHVAGSGLLVRYSGYLDGQ